MPSPRSRGLARGASAVGSRCRRHGRASRTWGAGLPAGQGGRPFGFGERLRRQCLSLAVSSSYEAGCSSVAGLCFLSCSIRDVSHQGSHSYERCGPQGVTESRRSYAHWPMVWRRSRLPSHRTPSPAVGPPRRVLAADSSVRVAGTELNGRRDSKPTRSATRRDRALALSRTELKLGPYRIAHATPTVRAHVVCH